jgi:hypothetical protein
VGVHLRRQLAGRRQDQHAGGAARLAQQAVQDRQQEGGRLAAAGHGAGEDVLPRQGGGIAFSWMGVGG